jgi:hypothetical protein
MKAKPAQTPGHLVPGEDRFEASFRPEASRSLHRLNLLANAMCDLAAGMARRPEGEVGVDGLPAPTAFHRAPNRTSRTSRNSRRTTPSQTTL